MAGKSSVMEAFSRQEEGNRSSRWRLKVASSTTLIVVSESPLLPRSQEPRHLREQPSAELAAHAWMPDDGRDRLGLPIGGQDYAKQDDPGDVDDRNREADERD